MKPYNGEKAIISLTSWKARINTVGLTLFSLVKRCPGFHIVLVLSEEEFPKKEAELPDSVMAFVDQDLIEILWEPNNTKCWKKFNTILKYKSVPLIITDDDIIITSNFCQTLYDTYLKNPNAIISYTKSKAKPPYIGMACSLFPPDTFPHIRTLLYSIQNKIHEDEVFRKYFHRINYKIIGLFNHFPFFFHNEINPINGSNKIKIWKKMQRYE